MRCAGSSIISFIWAERNRNADRLLHDSRVEVNVRIEVAAHEILVAERYLLELQRDLEERIVLQSQLFEHVVAGLAHDLCARVIALVDAVAEAHEADSARVILHL